MDGTARIWDLSPSHELLGLSADNAPVSSVAISPDAMRMATAGRQVRVWEMATGKQLYELNGHTGFVDSFGSAPMAPAWRQQARVEPREYGT
jgi:WD40 repeat protein